MDDKAVVAEATCFKLADVPMYSLWQRYLEERPRYDVSVMTCNQSKPLDFYSIGNLYNLLRFSVFDDLSLPFAVWR